MSKFNSSAILLILLIIFSYSCNDNTPPFGTGLNTDGINIEGTSTVDAMNTAVTTEGVTISNNPLLWTDQQLSIFNGLAEKKIVGLGQATHGTSEFSIANHRIFKYLVEQFDFKILVTQTDIGESTFINEAIWEGRKSDINGLMKEHMQEWDWQTEELKVLLEWMCEYNKDKPENERLVYMGNDFKSFDLNSALVKKYIQENNTSVHEAFLEFLTKYVSFQEEVDFFDADIKDERFNEVISKLENTITKYENEKEVFDQSGGSSSYAFYHRMLIIIKSSIIHEYNYPWPSYYQHPLISTTDMAENIIWMHENFNEKLVYWGSNTYVSEVPGGIGDLLKQSYLQNYFNIGFSFSKGTFNASFYSRGINIFEIKTPQEYSLDYMFSRLKTSFIIDVNNLISYPEWSSYFDESVRYVAIPETYNPYYKGSYYSLYEPHYFDFMIHLDNMSPTNLLN